MIHTFEILYILNRRAATYCAFKLNQRVNTAEKKSNVEIRRFLRTIHIRRNSEGIRFKGLRIPGIHEMDLLKMKNAPGSFFLYIMIEPEVLLTGENTLDVFFCSIPNAKHLQSKYAQAIFELFPKAFEGRPPLQQVRFHDQPEIHEDEWKLGGLFMIPYLALALISRIDFCANYKLDNASLYVEMVRKSYYHPRRKNVKFKNLNPYSELKGNDTLFYDKTSGFCIYDKGSKMWSHGYDRMHNIAQIREEAENVIRIERPFYKVTKTKLMRLTGLKIPEARVCEEAPLKLGPMPFLIDEGSGLKTIFDEYKQCVLGIKRTKLHEYDIVNRQEFKWVSTKRFLREMDRLLEEKQIRQQWHDTVLKMAYATSEARSVKRGMHNCNVGTHIYWGQDEEGNKIRIPYQRSSGSFYDTWQRMHELGMMLFRIPNERYVEGQSDIEVDEEGHVQELDANFIFDVNNMVSIGIDLKDTPVTSGFHFLPYKVVRGYDTPDPLEVRHNYAEILSILYQRLWNYIENSAQ